MLHIMTPASLLGQYDCGVDVPHNRSAQSCGHGRCTCLRCLHKAGPPGASISLTTDLLFFFCLRCRSGGNTFQQSGSAHYNSCCCSHAVEKRTGSSACPDCFPWLPPGCLPQHPGTLSWHQQWLFSAEPTQMCLLKSCHCPALGCDAVTAPVQFGSATCQMLLLPAALTCQTGWQGLRLARHVLLLYGPSVRTSTQAQISILAVATSSRKGCAQPAHLRSASQRPAALRWG